MKKTIIILIACMLMVSGCGKTKNTVNSLDDLEGKTIGVQMKTTGDIYSSDIKDAQIKRFNKGEDAVKALQKGVVDAVMIDDEPAKVFAEKYEDVKILSEPYAEEEYGIAVNKEEQKLLRQINQALDELKKEGTLDEIKKAWLQNGEKKTAYSSKSSKTGQTELIMATNAEFPPYESKDSSGEIVGIDVDMMKAVCDKLDRKLKITDTAFDSIVVNVERKMADAGVAAMTITEERKKYVDFSDSYMTATQVVIVRK